MDANDQRAAERVSETVHRTQSIAALMIGLDLARASALAESGGRVTRVERQDGQRFALLANYRTNRIDLTLKNGIVVAARVG